MAIVPIPSAAVERVFSKVKCIIETTVVSALKDSLGIRVMERFNHYPNSI